MSKISQRFNSRYGKNVPPPDLPWNDTLDTLFSHKSIRYYLSTPLPDGALDLLIAAAQSAASSSNLQLWSAIAVTDSARKQRLAKLANDQIHIDQAPLFLVWLADLSRLGHILHAQGVTTEQIAQLELFLIAVVDATLAAQNAVIAAEAQGWGTVYIGALRHRTDDVAAELNLPPYVFPVFGLCVGYPDAASPADIKPRLPQSLVLHQEIYAATHSSAELARYDDTMRAFYTLQGMNVAGGWTQHCAERIVARQADSTNRSPLVASLKNLGFTLT